MSQSKHKQDVELNDDILFKIIRDFVASQNKLKAKVEQAKSMGIKQPRFSHYILSENTLENFVKNYAA